MKRFLLVFAFALALLPVTAQADLLPLPADQIKIIGTTETGDLAALYCANGYCLDYFNQHPNQVETVSGRMYHRVLTRYGWSYTYVYVTVTCVPDDTYASYIRPKTFRC